MTKKIACFIILNLLGNTLCVPVQTLVNNVVDEQPISEEEKKVFADTVEYVKELMRKENTIPIEQIEGFDKKMEILGALVSNGTSKSEIRDKLFDLFPMELEIRPIKLDDVKQKRFIVEITIFAVITIGSALIAAIASAYVSDHLATKREEYLRNLPPPDYERSTENCKKTEAGCLENLCWKLCGPRVSHRDFCFTAAPDGTRASTHSVGIKNQTIPLTECNNDADCDSCWACASTCTLND